MKLIHTSTLVVLLAILLLGGCNQIRETNCDHPYILVGTSCCLDVNENSVCDDHEENMLVLTEPEMEIVDEPAVEETAEIEEEIPDYFSQTYQAPIDEVVEEKQYDVVVDVIKETSVPASGMLKMHILDIENSRGQSVVVETPSGDLILIDTAMKTYGSVIKRFLKESLNANAIDLLIISSIDDNLIGGYDTLRTEFPVGLLVDNGAVSNTFQYYKYNMYARSGNYDKIDRDSVFEFDDGVNVELLVSYDTLSQSKMDSTDSIVVRITYGDVAYLIMTDCVGICETEVLDTAEVKANVIVLADHGDADGAKANFLDEVSPDYASIAKIKAIPAKTRYRLDNAGIKLYNTFDYGIVTFSTDGTSVSVDNAKLVDPGSLYKPEVKTVDKYY
jgi:competence protein ComEC